MFLYCLKLQPYRTIKLYFIVQTGPLACDWSLPVTVLVIWGKSPTGHRCDKFDVTQMFWSFHTHWTWGPFGQEKIRIRPICAHRLSYEKSNWQLFRNMGRFVCFRFTSDAVCADGKAFTVGKILLIHLSRRKLCVAGKCSNFYKGGRTHARKTQHPKRATRQTPKSMWAKPKCDFNDTGRKRSRVWNLSASVPGKTKRLPVNFPPKSLMKCKSNIPWIWLISLGGRSPLARTVGDPLSVLFWSTQLLLWKDLLVQLGYNWHSVSCLSPETHKYTHTYVVAGWCFQGLLFFVIFVWILGHTDKL